MYIEADTHCHTVASTHAYSTVLEMATSAQNINLKGIAITDHTEACPDAPHIWHFHNLKKGLPRKINDVTLIFGAEVNIMDIDGNLDLDESELKRLEWIIASMHGTITQNGSYEDYTNAYLNAASNPWIDVIGHPAMNNFKFDYEKVLKVFKEYNKLVEINESALVHKHKVRENSIEIIKICKKYEIPIVVNSDAHFCFAVGDVSNSQKLLDEFCFPRDLVLNSNWDRLCGHIVSKHGNIF